MKYIIQKGELKRSKWLFIGIGIFLISMSSYELYNFLQINEFVYEYPGDWDKVLLIPVGIFLLIRSRKFVVRSRDLFVKVSDDHLEYRVKKLDSVQKITLSNIEKIQKKDGEIILTTKGLTKLTIADFNKARIKDNKRELITKALIQLNKNK